MQVKKLKLTCVFRVQQEVLDQRRLQKHHVVMTMKWKEMSHRVNGSLKDSAQTGESATEDRRSVVHALLLKSYLPGKVNCDWEPPGLLFPSIQIKSISTRLPCLIVGPAACDRWSIARVLFWKISAPLALRVLDRC